MAVNGLGADSPGRRRDCGGILSGVALASLLFSVGLWQQDRKAEGSSRAAVDFVGELPRRELRVREPERKNMAIEGFRSAEGSKEAEDAAWGGVAGCAERKHVLVVPAVRKGLNNQRMRFVQDLVVAALLGAAVELPPMINTRLNCANDVSCYKDYHQVLPLADVYDVDALFGALRKLGFCVRMTLEPKEAASLVPGWITPVTAKEIQLERDEGDDEDGAEAPRPKLPRREGRYALADEEACCTMLVPNTDRALALLAGVNRAFDSATRIRDDAARVIEAARARSNSGVVVALHWRADGDFVASQHALNSEAYVAAAAKAIASLRKAIDRVVPNTITKQQLVILLLGDLTVADLGAIQSKLAAVMPPGPEVSLQSKARLLPYVDWGEAFHGRDDAKGQLDYEIGVRADIFIGSPFSSFSVLLAHQRRSLKLSPAATLDTMISVDISDNLARIFSAIFPYKSAAFATNHRCTSLVSAHGAYAPRLKACAHVERSAEAASRLASTLHQVPDCTVCNGAVSCDDFYPAVTDSAWNDTAMDALLSPGVVGLPAPSWGCMATRKAIENHGVLRDPMSGRIYVRGAERLSAHIADFFSKAWRDLAERRLPAPTVSLLPPVDDVQASFCEDVAPTFTFPTKIDDFAETGRICHVAVVTAVFGELDELDRYDAAMPTLAMKERRYGISVCWFAFVDDAAAQNNLVPEELGKPRPKHGVWDVIVLPKTKFHFPTADRAGNSRLPKMLFHRALGSTPFAIYLDGKVRLKHPEQIPLLVHYAFLPTRRDSSPAWFGMRHPRRRSAYEEARCVKILNLVGSSVLDQMQAYYDAGFPSTPYNHGGPGLIEGMFHMRDLRRPESGILGCEWFQELNKYPHKRDQLSFNYLAWRMEQRVGPVSPILGYVDPKRHECPINTVDHKVAAGQVARPLSTLCEGAVSGDAIADKVGELARMANANSRWYGSSRWTDAGFR